MIIAFTIEIDTDERELSNRELSLIDGEANICCHRIENLRLGLVGRHHLEVDGKERTDL